MARFTIATATAALMGSTMIAQIAYADISRTDQSMRILFEEVGPTGNYAELSYGRVQPEASTNSTPGVGNPLGDYTLPGFGYLYQLDDTWSFAVTYDTPFGGNTAYPTASAFFGGFADVDTDSLTVMARYRIDERISIHAGVRAMQAEGTIFTNVGGGAPNFHRLSGDSDTGIGYVIGAAYEIPDIALRVALTYNSPVEVTFDATEIPAPAPLGPGGATTQTTFDLEFPESVNLEFQSGIAQDTLVFGSIRHAFWDGFTLATPGAGQYLQYTSDTTTYTLGVGRRFNENWSGSVSYTHRTDGTVPSDTPLSPTTGLDALTVALRYEQETFTISGGITYGIPGDQNINNALVPGGVNFDDNEVLAVGLRVGFRF